LAAKPEGKRQLGRHSCRWEDSIKMDYRETGWGAVGWIYVGQDKDHWQVLVKAVIESSGSIKCWKFLSS
jgi:hypothetical protein